ncbi:MAG: glycine C-acetyltransferase [Candidatus Andeanibacterium colombiense]|uniref:2-amino-3-ketobutyrate coenzyme A ligase n=1 Tax=Candidatus Andeanibacterium colombiense TaxID=3121345 RepID=A0AAJ5X9Z5_9SPHN|nr:MAG: glycine C-acetyltransferase [Sphingomonadaceae bacterium]
MTASFLGRVGRELADIDARSLTKVERLLLTPQGADVSVRSGNGSEKLLNFCANNYLGLADNPAIMRAAFEAGGKYGFGMASVRFICGTLDLHRQLEAAIADYLGCDDAITFAACFDANGAVFEPLLGEQDAIVSDSLNHASIIDGVRLSKARRYRFANGDMDALETQLRKARDEGARDILVVTDGVFSMDGYLADLTTIRALADRFEAMVMVDDCHSTGVLGVEGAGTPSHFGLHGKIDILTGTLGKALGGGMGGYIAARQPVIDLLRQRARPYLFSNALAPMLAGGSLRAIELARAGDPLRQRLRENAGRFRTGLAAAGFTLLPGEHPIIPVMTGDAALASQLAAKLHQLGIYVTPFSYPVVPESKARIRTQMSAAHTHEQIDKAIAAFAEAGRETGVIS